MMNLNALKIDPEFQGKIPPLTFEELNQLEANILRDGRIINPIIVWQGLIVDGHNRYTIAKKHPEIPFTVHEKEFASRYEAIIWICKNQLPLEAEHRLQEVKRGTHQSDGCIGKAPPHLHHRL